MSHGPSLKVDVEGAIKAGPIKARKSTKIILSVFTLIGLATFILGIVSSPKNLWGAFYINLLFWMGLAAGGVITTVIFQIVRAKWAASIRRIAEANISFLPWAYGLLLITYFGKEYLFPWGVSGEGMPGREWWMQPDFVYARFAIMLGLLFFCMHKFVSMSLRSDIGTLRADSSHKENWRGWTYRNLTKNWKGESETKDLQRKMSIFGPVLIFLYAVIYSLFAFEMIMGMDTIWFSNMFGGFNFVGNVYMGWTSLALLVMYIASRNSAFAKNVSKDQLWDLGKLMLGFAILWAYLFISQYLPQWYGNMPEETQWMILRTRGEWRPFAYLTLGASFVVPFLLLLSEDVKKTPKIFATICSVCLLGVWMEKYMVVMPQLTPDSISLKTGPYLEVGLFIGFLGLYGLCIANFLRKYPFLPVSHPMTKGSVDW